MNTRSILVTYAVVKALHGHLEGIEVTDTLTCDPSLGAPFTAGQRVAGLGGDYTVVSVTP